MPESKRSTRKPSLEKSFQSKVLRELGKVEGLYVFKKEAAAIRGIPDVIGCYKGRFFAWELKRDEKSKPSPMQLYNLDKINQAGGIGRLVSPENFNDSFLELTGIVLA